jgi:hypothetical protein
MAEWPIKHFVPQSRRTGESGGPVRPDIPGMPAGPSPPAPGGRVAAVGIRVQTGTTGAEFAGSAGKTATPAGIPARDGVSSDLPYLGGVLPSWKGTPDTGGGNRPSCAGRLPPMKGIFPLPAGDRDAGIGKRETTGGSRETWLGNRGSSPAWRPELPRRWLLWSTMAPTIALGERVSKYFISPISGSGKGLRRDSHGPPGYFLIRPLRLHTMAIADRPLPTRL